MTRNYTIMTWFFQLTQRVLNVSARILYKQCPLCDNEGIVDHTTGDCSQHALYRDALPAKMQWKRCLRCDHVFTDGYFNSKTAKLIFSKTNAEQRVGYDIERQRYISARIVDRVLPFINNGSWLDVGFGNGSLLFTAQEYGFTPVGVDLRENSVSAMNSFGIRAYCTDLTKLSLPNPCSVISMADVLEHMPFPKEGLSAAYNLLAERGILFASMPNSEAMIWKVLDHGNANPYWGELEHYHNFSRTRLYQLLEEHGFEPLQYGISERYRACMEVIARKK